MVTGNRPGAGNAHGGGSAHARQGASHQGSARMPQSVRANGQHPTARRAAQPHPTARPASHRQVQHPAPHAGARPVTHGVAASSYVSHGNAGGTGGRAPLVMLAIVLVLAIVGGGGLFYWTSLRNVTVTVNGTEKQVGVSSTLDDMLQSNGYFGVKPGRLMSVGGNVLSEDGGERCRVLKGDEEIKTADLSTRKAEEGASYTVKNGADTTEDAKEEKVTIAPTIKEEAGGAIQYVSQWGVPGEKIVAVGKTSGEKADKKVTKKAKDMVVSSRTPEPEGGKYMALTFDDGPSAYTQKILDILAKKKVKATFFNLGSQAGEYPDLTKAVVESGHELASHTNAHQYLPNLNRDDLRKEITSAFDTLEDASGTRPQMMRAPYGSFTSAEWARSGDIISSNVLWNIDTLDWKLPGASAIKSMVLDNAFNGAIVLMHDGGGNREQDVQALPGIIDGLQKAGYKLITVSELMELDGNFPKDVVKGTVKLPKDAVMPEK